MKINQKLLKSLVDNVIYPVERSLVEKAGLDDENATKLLQKIGFLKISLIPFAQDIEANNIKEHLKPLQKLYNLSMDTGYVKELISYYKELFYKWIRDNNFECKHKEILNESFDLLLDEKDIQTEEEIDTSFYDEEFFDFDDKGNEIINDMHYKDHEKISAEEFMSLNDVDMDLVYDLQDYLKAYFSSAAIYLDEETLEEVKVIIRKITTIFELSVEFKTLAHSFYKLLEILEGVGIHKNSDMVKMFLDTIMEDLEKWLQHIFIDQDANDIHYLDASLFSSIEQLEILLRGDNE